MHPEPGLPRTRSWMKVNKDDRESGGFCLTHHLTRFDLATDLVENDLLPC